MHLSVSLHHAFLGGTSSYHAAKGTSCLGGTVETPKQIKPLKPHLGHSGALVFDGVCNNSLQAKMKT